MLTGTIIDFIKEAKRTGAVYTTNTTAEELNNVEHPLLMSRVQGRFKQVDFNHVVFTYRTTVYVTKKELELMEYS